MLAVGLIGIVVLAIARLTAGPDVPTFRVTFPAQDGIVALTVSVEDHSGVVTAIQGVPSLPDGLGGSSNFGITSVPGEASAFRLWWMGGACDRDTTVRLTDAPGGGIHLDIRTARGLVMSCSALGVYRVVDIQTMRPIDPSEVGLSFEPG